MAGTPAARGPVRQVAEKRHHTMSDIALVTANFGAFDEVTPLPDHEGIDACYYTDEATRLATPPCRFASWTRVLVPNYPRHDFGPRIRSRYFKHQIHRLDEVRTHRWLVWADSSLQFHDLRFLHCAFRSS